MEVKRSTVVSMINPAILHNTLHWKLNSTLYSINYTAMFPECRPWQQTFMGKVPTVLLKGGCLHRWGAQMVVGHVLSNGKVSKNKDEAT